MKGFNVQQWAKTQVPQPRKQTSYHKTHFDYGCHICVHPHTLYCPAAVIWTNYAQLWLATTYRDTKEREQNIVAFVVGNVSLTLLLSSISGLVTKQLFQAEDLNLYFFLFLILNQLSGPRDALSHLSLYWL